MSSTQQSSNLQSLLNHQGEERDMCLSTGTRAHSDMNLHHQYFQFRRAEFYYPVIGPASGHYQARTANTSTKLEGSGRLQSKFSHSTCLGQ